MKRKTPCKRCAGTGLEPDHSETGKLMRSKREDTGVSLRTVATAMEISAPYLSDMELGRRGWSSEMIQRADRAIAKFARSK